MTKYYYIFDYYLKGLNPDCYRHVAGALRDLKNSYMDKRILNPEEFMKDYYLDATQYNELCEIVFWEYENINRYLLKYQRRPFFNTNNLKECIKLRDELLEFISEKECMEKYGVTTFKEYVPEIFKNDLVTVLDIYIDDKYIKKALQHQNPPHVNLTSGLAHYNCYKFVNWMLLYNGMKPLFENVDDEEECNKKRKELLKLLPKSECFKYWNIEDENDLDKYKIKPLVFKIEKYIKCFGTDTFNTPWRHHLGCKLYNILNPDLPIIDKKRYIKEANRINESIIFKDEENVEEAIRFLQEHLEYVEKEWLKINRF